MGKKKKKSKPLSLLDKIAALAKDPKFSLQKAKAAKKRKAEEVPPESQKPKKRRKQNTTPKWEKQLHDLKESRKAEPNGEENKIAFKPKALPILKKTKKRRSSTTSSDIEQNHDLQMPSLFGEPSDPGIWNRLEPKKVFNLNYWCIRMHKKNAKNKEFITLDGDLQIKKNKELFQFVVKTYVFADPENEPSRRYARNAILRHFGISHSKNPFIRLHYDSLFSAAAEYEPLLSGEELVALFKDILTTIGAPVRGRIAVDPVEPEDFESYWLQRALEIFAVIVEAQRDHLPDEIYAKFFNWYVRISMDNTAAFAGENECLPLIQRNLTCLVWAYLENSDIQNAVQKILQFVGSATTPENADQLCCLVLQMITPLRNTEDDKLRTFLVHAAYKLLHKLIGNNQAMETIPDDANVGDFMPEKMLKLTKQFTETKPHIIKWKAFVRAGIVALLFSEVPELTQGDTPIKSALHGIAREWENFSESSNAKSILPEAKQMDYSIALKNCRQFSQEMALKLYRAFNLEDGHGSDEETLPNSDVAE